MCFCLRRKHHSYGFVVGTCRWSFALPALCVWCGRHDRSADSQAFPLSGRRGYGLCDDRRADDLVLERHSGTARRVSDRDMLQYHSDYRVPVRIRRPRNVPSWPPEGISHAAAQWQMEGNAPPVNMRSWLRLLRRGITVNSGNLFHPHDRRRKGHIQVLV